MAEAASLTSGIAGRYATALFELAGDEKKRDVVEKDMVGLAEALDASDDLKSVISSPAYTRDQQGGVMAALAKKMKLNALTGNVLGLMASKRRLFALPAMIDTYKAMMADDRGEVAAEVTSATKLTAAQEKSLAASLKKAAGRDVTLNVTVDESLIGGLVVKLGSRMIDTSIRSRLANLQNAMKEVG